MLHIDFLPNESIVQLKQTKQCSVESKCRWSEAEKYAAKKFSLYMVGVSEDAFCSSGKIAELEFALFLMIEILKNHFQARHFFRNF